MKLAALTTAALLLGSTAFAGSCDLYSNQAADGSECGLRSADSRVEPSYEAAPVVVVDREAYDAAIRLSNDPAYKARSAARIKRWSLVRDLADALAENWSNEHRGEPDWDANYRSISEWIPEVEAMVEGWTDEQIAELAATETQKHRDFDRAYRADQHASSVNAAAMQDVLRRACSGGARDHMLYWEAVEVANDWIFLYTGDKDVDKATAVYLLTNGDAACDMAKQATIDHMASSQ
ncbi:MULTISPECIES: hypothetical protein [Pacificibacter]|uniref:hypothetical protein n=1 Tax=Pacificibacter TaxID=1042323 RepID=UPI0020916957|nr:MULTISPECIES: hypothetical protein [Pacificibacter]MDO6617396.1 hypothetical protein [Pacificibacter sp. 1_MG-2023]